MKRLMFGLAGALACAAAVQAAEPAVQQQPVAPEASAQAAHEVTNTERGIDDRLCLSHAGSMIRSRADKKTGRCIDANGRSYSREDLDRTGEVNIADALRKLDPAIR